MNWLEGYRTYIGAAVLAAAAFAGAVGWLTTAQAEWLGGFGLSIIAIGLRAAIERLLQLAAPLKGVTEIRQIPNGDTSDR